MRQAVPARRRSVKYTELRVNEFRVTATLPLNESGEEQPQNSEENCTKEIPPRISNFGRPPAAESPRTKPQGKGHPDAFRPGEQHERSPTDHKEPHRPSRRTSRQSRTTDPHRPADIKSRPPLPGKTHRTTAPPSIRLGTGHIRGFDPRNPETFPGTR